ncbi:hypothetical protein [Streptomyces sp. NPDC005955]|uniref:hypothetical protein n=1 Tax=Streptomyces sp. NPDC005955 TaxID=3364738 RepID=UPI0036776A15
MTRRHLGTDPIGADACDLREADLTVIKHEPTLVATPGTESLRDLGAQQHTDPTPPR